jgi:PAS domain S-box-containing protein
LRISTVLTRRAGAYTAAIRRATQVSRQYPATASTDSELPVLSTNLLADNDPDDRPPQTDEAAVLRQRNETLARDLEQKQRELQEANRRLAAREAELQAILDAEPECVKLLDADGALRKMNPAGLRMIEAQSFDQVANHCMYPLVVEAHREAFKALVERVFRGESGMLEFEIVGLAGHRRWLETRVAPLRDEHGRVSAALGVTRDITARIQAEQALRESEERFRSLVELTSDFYWEQDEQLRFVSRIGTPWETQVVQGIDVIGKTRWDLATLNMSEADWARHRADLEARREFRNLEVERPLPAGGSRWVSTSGRPIVDAEGRFRGYRGVGQDITARKRAEIALRAREAELRLIADHVPAMIAYLDADCRYRYANRAYLDFYANGSKSIEGQTVEQVLDLDLAAQVRASVRRVMAGETLHFETARRRRDASERIVSVTMVPNVAEDGKVMGGFSFIVDVTERIEAEQARLVHAKLESANQELNAFSYTVAHDLRAPLRAILGFAGLLREADGERLSTEGKRALARMEAGVHRLHDLIEALLNYARSARANLKLVDLDLAALAAEAAETLQSAYPAARVQIGPLPKIRGDRALLWNVLMNLISNALKFSAKREHPLVEIGTVSTARGRAVFVRDNGAGFDPKYAAKLFGVFHRLHTEREFPGLGIGLAFAKRVLTRHGSEIWAESQPDEGATFYFTTPRSR